MMANNLAYEAGLTAGPTTGLTIANLVLGVDPQFVNPAAADFALQAGSPARGAGVPLPFEPTDLDGALLSATPDLGAYRYQ
jgi:hypothetical protein